MLPLASQMKYTKGGGAERIILQYRYTNCFLSFQILKMLPLISQMKAAELITYWKIINIHFSFIFKCWKWKLVITGEVHQGRGRRTHHPAVPLILPLKIKHIRCLPQHWSQPPSQNDAALLLTVMTRICMCATAHDNNIAGEVHQGRGCGTHHPPVPLHQLAGPRHPWPSPSRAQLC